MIQEASSIKKIGMKQYSFISGTMEPIDGVVSFSPQDLTRVIVPHEDVLVLSLKIARFQVCRVLVDLGSSADLFHIFTYKQMGIPISTLGSLGRVLTSLNGLTTWYLGEIVLPVEVDSIAMNVCFSVVSNHLPYNTILGQAWIHKMKATPSTYHQKVDFLTKTGQIDLFESQLAARQCYQVKVRPVGEEIKIPALTSSPNRNSNY